jgi:ParB-like chromosome segregation protein Spo0J
VVYMHAKEGKSVEQIAAALSKSRSWVLNRLMVPDLPEHLREPLMSGDAKWGHIEVLSKLTDHGAQQYLVSQVIQNRWSVLQLRQIAEAYHNSPGLADVKDIRQISPYGTVVHTPLKWECEACGAVGAIEAFRLVRVCRDGCRQESSPVGSTEAGGGVARVDDHSDESGGGEDNGNGGTS